VETPAINPPCLGRKPPAEPQWFAKSHLARDHFRLCLQAAINVIARMAAMNGI
jgi:hypothetical protein